MKNFSFIILITFHLSGCSALECNDLPNSFKDFNEALMKVKESNFNMIEEVDTSKSSWIEGLEYYSCDSKIGFLIIKTKDREYIHQNVPLELWVRFKATSSYGSFYNSEVKGKYKTGIN